jgi:hypothetical protein
MARAVIAKDIGKTAVTGQKSESGSSDAKSKTCARYAL